MSENLLEAAIASVPPGGWAVGVSGGADSVALLMLLQQRTDLKAHVVHLDHETRGGLSALDAAFVEKLAGKLALPCTIGKRSLVEKQLTTLARNRSARYRAARIALFSQVVTEQGLEGVLLAHHVGDQAETAIQRLLRGGGPRGLGGMARSARIGNLRIVRPLLEMPAQTLRIFLRAIHQDWREDDSNASPIYLRNRLRKVLAVEPELTESLLQLSESCRALSEWVDKNSPKLKEQFSMRELADLPVSIAREAAHRWLIERGVPANRMDVALCNRLIELAADAATPARLDFPGTVIVRRRGSAIFSERPVSS